MLAVNRIAVLLAAEFIRISCRLEEYELLLHSDLQISGPQMHATMFSLS